MPFCIVRQDITKMKVDAIVNAANTELLMGGGVCGAIFKAAGSEKLLAACSKVAPIHTGGAAITPGFALPAKYIIHAAGPVYDSKAPEKSEKQLRSAYFESLRLAYENKCRTIAFPLISSGIYGYPKEEALKAASSAIRDFLFDHEMDVYLAVFDKAAFAVSEKLLGEVERFIDEHYVDEREHTPRHLLFLERRELLSEKAALSECDFTTAGEISHPTAGVDKALSALDEPFNTVLLRLIDAKGKTDVEVYKKANIDRKLFSKIRTGKGYLPSKRTVLALAFALELNLAKTEDLLRCAGYALSRSHKFDVIIEYFVSTGKYDIFEVNEVLFKYDQQLLGG